jgi:acetylornithine deacetylase/succinyl-diaminopimelate desuccinylase-like protein
LIYGHYDVQPVDHRMSDTPPFEPIVRDDLGRGASDDRQLFTHVKALSPLRTGELPVNVICLFEGEEETAVRSDHICRTSRRLEGRRSPFDMRIWSDRSAITAHYAEHSAWN